MADSTIMRRCAALFLVVAVAGCPELEVADDSPSDGEPTEAQAAMAASAVANVAMQLGGGSFKPSAQAVQLAALALPSARVSATVTSRCDAQAIPAVSPATPYRVTVDSGEDDRISGSATFAVEFGERTIAALASFDLFAFAPMTMDFTFDGSLGYRGTVYSASEDYISLTLDTSSKDFALYYDDPDDGGPRVCDVVVNLENSASMTIDETSVSYQRTLDGCISLCGLAFAITGSESGTVYLP